MQFTQDVKHNQDQKNQSSPIVVNACLQRKILELKAAFGNPNNSITVVIDIYDTTMLLGPFAYKILFQTDPFWTHGLFRL